MRSRTIPTCHPDKEHGGKGLCRNCYQRQWMRKLRSTYEGREWDRRWDRTASRLEKKRQQSRERKYGLDVEEFERRRKAQNNKCATCHGEFVEGKIHVDHDHACCPTEPTCGYCTRGLLCNDCNLALGLFKDNIATLHRAIAYIETFNEVRINRRGVVADGTD